jgi:hypothetical protein
VPKGENDFTIRFIAATEYAIETSVKGTSVNYQELGGCPAVPAAESGLAQELPPRCAPLWEEGHIMPVRRSTMPAGRHDAIESIDPIDMRKVLLGLSSSEPALTQRCRENSHPICEQLFNPDWGSSCQTRRCACSSTQLRYRQRVLPYGTTTCGQPG